MSDLRQHFYVTGVLQVRDKDDRRVIALLNRNHLLLTRNHVWKWLIWAVPAVWCLLVGECMAGLLPYSVLGAFFAVAFVVSYLTAKKVATVHQLLDKMERILSTYASLIQCMEGETFQAAALRELQARFSCNGACVSALIRRLSRHVGALNQRFSLVGLLLNLFTLRDTRMAMQLERWNERYGSAAEGWFDALAVFDAYASLATFAFNHPDYVYPEITDRYYQMEG